MIETGFESRVKVQQIINNQLPEFVVSESPNAVDFFKQYYISQEYQGGPIDISDNLDQYIKVDNLTPEVIVGSTTLSSGITTSSTVISVDNTKGFPNQYGLLKIDDEIVTYTGISPTTFTGCIRGFSGITSYHAELNREELVFSTSSVDSHDAGSNVKNLSSLFLKEFYKKLKFSLTPGMEEVDFQPDINVGNFIKEARSLYEAKGTDESFRILFNVLYGETPKVINLEDYLIKPSAAEYIRREIIIAEVISGNPKKLIGQTIYKVGDLTTNAAVSEVEPFTRVGVALTSNQQYYKLSLFLGPNDKETSIQGTFSITPASKCLEPVAIGSSVISVDSTVGFGVTGNIISGINTNITYTNKGINQFYGCEGIVSEINSADIIRNNDIYFGYPDGDTSSTVELRLTGVLSQFEQVSKSVDIDENQILSVKNLGDLIKNPIRDRSYKEIFANSWIYNTSTRYRIKEGSGGSTLILYADVDRSSLKVGDQIEILKRGSNTVIHGGTLNVYVKTIIGASLDEWWSVKSTQIELTEALPSVSYEIDLRRKLSTPTSRYVPLLYNKTISDTQNLYVEKDENFYVASNSLPSGTDIPSSSGLTGPDYRIPIDIQLQSVQAKGLTDGTKELGYGEIEFENTVPFIDGDEIFYDSVGSNNIYVGLETGNYFVGISEGSVDKKKIRLYNSRALINNSDYIKVNTTSDSVIETGHQFTLASQKTGSIGPQKILKKFPFNTRIDDGNQPKTEPGTTGLLIDGVEISNYKGNDKIYYGPLDSVDVLGEGEDYDVINPPDIQISTGIGTTALVQAVVQGVIKDVLVDPQGYAVKDVISLTAIGGNGSAVLEPLVISRSREMSFDGRIVTQGGGINTTTNQLAFSTSHTLSDYEEVIYKVGAGNTGLGVGVGATLTDNARYFVDVINNTTVQLYESRTDAQTGINTVTFNGNYTSGIHQFVTLPNQKAVVGIKVVNGGTFTNRKLRVNPLVGVSTAYNTVTFKNHGFDDGDLVNYTYQTTTIAGLSSANQYYINKIDDNTFRLSNAGVGGTIITNYERENTISFTNVGEGYQIFSYPDISVSLKYASVGFGTTTQTQEEMILTPIVKGGIIDTYLYESGTGYGSTILNFQKNPIISIKNGKNATVKPVFNNGKIDRVSIQYGGSEYFSIPTLDVIDTSGKGTGAQLRPVITDGRITDVVVVNTGIGYSHIDTSINVVSSGKNATLDVKIRPLTINLREKYKKFPNINNDYELETNISETILVNALPPDEREISLVDDNLKYTICGYGEPYRDAFGEVGIGITQASKIIGWAYDGNPIYGPYGYDDPGVIANPRRLRSGYEVNIDDMVDRPSGFSAGYFVEDYKFTNSGDLDRNNGRFGKTPEFPNGVYAYFATIKDVANQSDPEFPYFIGDSYRSTPVVQNITQKFDFQDSNLIRNTFPYRISDKNVDNDFIIETNEIERQKIEVESVTSGSVDKLTVVNPGENYKINDLLTFDETDTFGNGLRGEVSSLKGIDIVDLNTISSTYSNKVFSWIDEKTIKVTILPSHDWSNKDNIVVSGFSTNLASLNGAYSIGVSSLTAVLTNEIPSGTTGVSTEIFVSYIPNSLSIGSTINIGSSSIESAVLLNIFKEDNILRIKRGSTGVAWTASTPIIYVPDSFTINKSLDFFDSTPNDKFYFNPTKTVGFGTPAGISSSVTFTFGTELVTRDIPTQRIYLEDHPFTENQELSFSTGGGTAIQISDTTGSTPYALPSTVYVTNASKNTIGIKTGIGSTGGDYSDVFFRSGGSDSNDFVFESNFTQRIGKVDQFKTTVALSTSHDLKVSDNVVLNIEPQVSVGLGTTTPVQVKRQESTGYLLLDPIECTNSSVDVVADTFTLTDHKFKTGDAVYYESTSFPTGFSEKTYFVFVIDSNTIQLCETYIDATTVPPRRVDFTTNPSATHTFSRINPTIQVVNTNSLVFDLTHSSLADYKFKLYYDKDFKNEFVSTASTAFNVTSVGTIGDETLASLTIGYNSSLPRTLYYNTQKTGFISTADTIVPNYSEIEFTSSSYNTNYDIISVGSTTFNISLKKKPEELSYTQNECKTLVYDTTSLTSKGGINKTNIISSGDGYKKLPNFVGSSSTLGRGAYVVASSNEIGNANETRVINQGFEYSSDSTLQPTAYISPLIVVNNSNTIGIISITDGGSDYLTPPNVIIVDSTTGERINSGVIESNLTGATISSLEVISPPSGLPDIPVTLFTTNNTNGVGILTVNSNSTGIFTCYISTPSAGFSTFPFSKDDEVFVEGINKVGAAGSGFNSEDYGYKFGKVLDIDSTGINFRVDIDFSDLTTNTGIAVTNQESIATLINKNKYPIFTVTQKPDVFILGERLIRDQIELDLYITKSENDFIKVSGTDSLVVGDIIRGKDSGTIATISDITEYDGRYSVSFSVKKDIGWSDDIGKLSVDNQVTPNNDYYQNLSYTIQSSKGFDELRSPVSSLLHTSGLKNFADVGIKSTSGAVGPYNESLGKRTGIGSADFSLTVQDILGYNRVDTINDYDIANDLTTNNITSKFIEFSTKVLSDYFTVKSNEVIVIDDINAEFSNLDGDPSTYLDIIKLSSNVGFQNLFFRVSNGSNTDIQTTDLVLMNNGTNSVLLQKHILDDDNSIGEFSIYDTGFGESYLRFTPSLDPYINDYDLKLLKTEFNSGAGIGTYSIGFIDVTGAIGVATTSLIGGGITTSIITGTATTYHSFHTRNQLINTTTQEMNFVEVYVTHDGTDTFMSEYYIDNDALESYSDDLLGTFSGNLSGNVFSLDFENSSTDEIEIRSAIVGFGTTTVGVGTYRFKVTNEPDGVERSALYQSDYSKTSGTRNVVSFDKNLFNVIKSVVEVSIGSTKALHQVVMNHNTTSVYTQQGPYLSVGSTTSVQDSELGIGTFGGEYDSSNFVMKFYPNSEYTSSNIEVSSLSLAFYTSLDENNIDNINSFDYGKVSESLDLFFYNALNGQRVNRTNFTLKTNSIPIFGKTFDPNNSSVVDLTTGKFSISDHFFRTGEELVYTPKSTFVGVGSTPMQYTKSGIHQLPSSVFAIRDTADSFYIATTKSDAEAGTALTFVGVGTGNAHELSMNLSNTKGLITIDNIIQSPLAYSPISHTLDYNTASVLGGSGITTTATTFALSGIASLTPNDLLKIDSEYIKVKDIGVSASVTGPITPGIGTFPIIDVERGFVGTSATAHLNTTTAQLYKGSYNIIGQDIYFTEPPRGNPQINKTSGNLDYPRSDFNGRVYLRSDYSTNQIYDDISDKFTGIGQTFDLSVNGSGAVGMGTTGGNGLVLINNIYQRPTAENNPSNNFIIKEPVGLSTNITFTGIATITGDDIVINETDINENQLPRGGVIISLGSTPGLGYALAEGARGYLEIGAGGTITNVVGFATTGPSLSISTVTYNNATGVMDIVTSSSNNFELGIVNQVKLSGLEFSCAVEHAGITTTIFPEAAIGSGNTDKSYTIFDTTPVLYTHTFVSATSTAVNGSLQPTAATYNSLSGELVLTFGSAHGISEGAHITIANNSLTFTCSRDSNASQHTYPRTTDPASGVPLKVSNATANSGKNLTVNVGSSNNGLRRFTTNVGTSTIPHNYVTGGSVMPWYGNATYGSGYRGTVSIGVTDVAFTHKFISATTACITPNVGGAVTPTAVTYDGASGDLVLTVLNHGLTDSNTISIATTSLTFTCSKDQYSSYHSYPRPTDPVAGISTAITSYDTNTFTVNVGSSVGSDANITATVGAGGTLAFAITGPGTNYTNPQLVIPEASYTNLGVIGVSRLDVGATTETGTGLLLDLQVSAASTVGIGSTQFSVNKWEIVRNGYGFKRGDVFKPVGLVTAAGLASPTFEAEFTVLDTFQDAFAAWQFGQFDYIDDIKELQDGSRTRFQLKYDGDLLSFEAATDSGYNFINLENCLLIIINGVIQEPGTAYQFNGGTSFVFSEPPSPEDDVSIYFYRGTSESDTQLVTNIIPSIKKGDDVQLMRITESVDQNIRTIAAIENSSTIETNIYTGPGITTTNKSLSWTKQKNDKVVNGDIVYKSRGSLEALIFPTAKIISDLPNTGITSVFIDNSDLFDYDSPFTGNVDALVVDNSVVPIAANLTANVSTSGTISSLTIVDGGTGYSGVSTSLSIAIPPVGISVGVGTTATATATISNGVITATTITNPGLGYNSSNAPKVLAPFPTYKSELLDGINAVAGFTGIITGISTTTGRGTDLALKFHLDSTNTNWSTGHTLQAGYPIVISNTQIGTGVTSIYESGSGAVGIGTTFLDNIYRLAYIPHSVGTLGIITCNIAADTHVSGLTDSGNIYAPVGSFSWGRLAGTITRSTPIGIAVSNYTVNSGLTTFPSLQRRDEGIRDTGALDPS